MSKTTNNEQIVDYCLTIPGQFLFLKEDGACDLIFTKLSIDALWVTEDQAKILVAKYGLEATKRTTNISTEVIEEKIKFLEEIKW